MVLSSLSGRIAFHELIRQLPIQRLQDDIERNATFSPRHGNTQAIPLETRNLQATKLIYIPLSRSEIRLVKILPDEKTAPMCCEVFNVVQAASPTYQALSYLWGSQEDPQRITLNGIPWSITRSLASALYALRRSREERTIWVDAFAINQSDVTERSTQVAKMRSIYMFARSTIMWLGHGFAEVETLLNIIDLVTTSDALWTLCWKASPGNHLSPASHIFDALCTMAKFQYWSRAWVVQEIMFSQRVSVRYGSRRLKYDKLLDFWMAFVTTLDISGWKIANESDYKQSYAATLLETSGPAALPIPDSARNGSYFTVEQWLDYTDIKEASDRRDHVYAYYGCFHPTFREGMEIDYGKTSVQVNTQMTKLSIEALKHNALDIILRAEHTFKEPSQPSWVPSFGREGEARFRAPFGTRMVKKYKLNAGGPNNQAVRSAMTDIILSVRGVQIGTVNTFAMPLIEDAVDFKANDWFEGEDAIRATLIHFRQTWRSVRVPNCKNDVQSFIYSYLVRSVKAPDTTQQPQLVTFLQDMTKKPEEAVGYIKSMLFTGYHVGRRMFSYSWTQMPKTGGLGRETEMVTRFGLGPKEMITGDKVCVLLGCSIPVILRQLDGGHCIFIGGACVHGFMHGEAVDGKETEEFGIV